MRNSKTEVFTGKRRAFFFHFNKPESAKKGKPQISIHFAGVCHIVDNLQVSVSTYGRIRNKQPRFVMTGYASCLVINGGEAILW